VIVSARPVADEGSEVIEQDVNRPEGTAEAAYEPPLLTTIGSVAELTLIETMAVGPGSKPV